MSPTTSTDAPSAPAVVGAKGAAVAAKIERYVARVVATAPPLTEQQRGALADLLREVPR